MGELVAAVVDLVIDGCLIAVTLVLLAIAVGSLLSDLSWAVVIVLCVAVLGIVLSDVPDDVDRFAWALLRKRGAR